MTPYERVKAWRIANPEKVAEQARRYAQRHPETNKKAKEKYRSLNLERVRILDKEAAARRRRSDPEGQRRRSKAFGERLLAKREAIAGRPRPDACELCGELHGRVVWDHCHATGSFRGWLCDRCNKVLGLVYDSPGLLRDLARYLEVFRGQAHEQIEKGPFIERFRIALSEEVSVKR